ncbi:MAG: histidine phosphatase family protein [Candidatus Kaiserbacteria bacterium]|nr:MAG: histidine phosphatase family protein [Candidatus Kaiserbacteria bacterium]
MKVLMARHGQTDSNATGVIQGQRIDQPLNAEGRRQVEALAAVLASTKIDVIFSSPLKRARETAEIVSRDKNIPIELRKELMERDFGSLSGKTWDQVENADELKALDKAQNYDYRPLGGESALGFKKRFLKVVDEIKQGYERQTVLIVAHAGILRLAHLLFKETAVQHIGNASVEEFDV